MGYKHISNLYKDKRILEFKECYALEKIHGTSAHITFKLVGGSTINGELKFSSGGAKTQNFIALFDREKLTEKFIGIGHPEVTVYGEAYGGKMQGMSETYGKELKFVAFEVKIGEAWLNVPKAHDVCNKLDIDFVSYNLIPATIEAIEIEKETHSVQAVRNGIEEPKRREGIVLRPVEEYRDNRGNRIVSKHKNDEFIETKTKRKVDTEKLEVLNKANDIADEWVTPMRLEHVLQKFPEDVSMEDIPKIMPAMYEDVVREAEGEIIESKDLRKAIFTKTARMFKRSLQEKLMEGK